jgi:heat shock protein 4
MTTVGFDFGNKNCVIARCGRGGVDVLLNGSSNRLNPCVVSLQGKQRFMGEDAASIMKSNFKNTPMNIKRLLGRQFKEPEIQEEMARFPGLKYVELEDGTVGVEVSYNDEPVVLSMEQCVAMMLNKLVKITLQSTGAKPGDCVISIPGYYTDAQRQAMLNACDIAQLHCLRLLHEGTAAALEYGMFKSAKGIFSADQPQHVAFLDFGQSSFSVTIASYLTGKLTVVAAAHDRNLGGRNFDELIAKKIAAAFKAKHGDDPWENPKARLKLLDAAEKAKKTLSPAGVTEARISIECLYNDLDFNMPLTLEEFVTDSEPLLAAMTPPIMQALTQSKIAPADLSTVEIIGGSTRLGFVKSRMADILIGSGVPIDKSAMNNGLGTTMNADEAVARGTAWQAALLSTRFRVKEFQVLEAVAYPVKLSWEGGETSAVEDDGADDEGEKSEAANGAGSSLIFKKNEMTPNGKRVTFRRSEPFTIVASYDESALADLPPNITPVIRTCTIETPSDLAASEDAPKIRVNLKHNLHGIVHVSSAQLMEEIKEENKPVEEKKEGESEAKEDTSAAAEEPPKKKRFKKVDLNIKSSEVGMNKARLEAAIELEVKMNHQDKVIEETNAARNDVESYIYSQRDEIIGALAPFFTSDEKELQENALTAAEDWLYYGDGYDAQKSVYVEKLRDLKQKADKAVFRANEAKNREACISTLKRCVEEYRTWLNGKGSSNDCAHITDEERAIVRTTCVDAETWLYSQMESQGALEPNVDPVLTTEAIGIRRRELVDKCKPIMNKPKPKPPKEEKKEPEPTPAPEQAAPEQPVPEADAKSEDKAADEGKGEEEGKDDVAESKAEESTATPMDEDK